MSQTLIRPQRRNDEVAWRALWAADLAFYNTSVTQAVYQSTFAPLLGDDATKYQRPA